LPEKQASMDVIKTKGNSGKIDAVVRFG